MIYIDLNELQRTNRLTSQDFVEPDEFNLDKFGIKSPKELSGDKEKEFYDYVDKGWKADNETD